MATEPIDVAISSDVAAGLGRLVELGRDATPAMAEIAGLLERETRLRFQTETAPDGTKWKPSLRVTGYTDRGGEKVPGDGGQTLTLHGYLRNSIRSNFGADFAEAGPEASGPAAIYAGIHQRGGRIAPRPTTEPAEGGLQRSLKTPFGYFGAVVIPARPYLGWNAEMEAETLDILRRHAAGTLEGEA